MITLDDKRKQDKRGARRDGLAGKPATGRVQVT